MIWNFWLLLSKMVKSKYKIKIVVSKKDLEWAKVKMQNSIFWYMHISPSKLSNSENLMPNFFYMRSKNVDRKMLFCVRTFMGITSLTKASNLKKKKQIFYDEILKIFHTVFSIFSFLKCLIGCGKFYSVKIWLIWIAHRFSSISYSMISYRLNERINTQHNISRICRELKSGQLVWNSILKVNLSL